MPKYSEGGDKLHRDLQFRKRMFLHHSYRYGMDWTGEVRITRQSSKITRNVLLPGSDPRGRRYFWLSEQQFIEDVEPDTDHAAIRTGAVSITPLEIDHTHATSLEHLSLWSRLLEVSCAASQPQPKVR